MLRALYQCDIGKLNIRVTPAERDIPGHLRYHLMDVMDSHHKGDRMATVETRLITAEEFFLLPDVGPCELVRGKVEQMNQPGWRHGRISAKIASRLDRYLEDNNLGRVATNDAGVITKRDPDTVRGADVSYYSYTRLPANQDPDDYPALAPEIVWEVKSPSDRWKDILIKVGEYLTAGVLVVCVVDPERQCFTTYYSDRPAETLQLESSWRDEALLPGFELPLIRVFGNKTG